MFIIVKKVTEKTRWPKNVKIKRIKLRQLENYRGTSATVSKEKPSINCGTHYHPTATTDPGNEAVKWRADRKHQQLTVNPLKGRDINWLHFAVQV